MRFFFEKGFNFAGLGPSSNYHYAKELIEIVKVIEGLHIFYKDDAEISI